MFSKTPSSGRYGLLARRSSLCSRSVAFRRSYSLVGMHHMAVVDFAALEPLQQRVRCATKSGAVD